MAKNPSSAGSSTTTTTSTTTSTSGDSLQDPERPLAASVGGDPQPSASSEAVGNTPKMDVKSEAAAAETTSKTATSATAAATTTSAAGTTTSTTTTAASESQAEVNASANSSKVRKLTTSGGASSPRPEDPVLDIKCLLLADATLTCVPLHLRQLLEGCSNLPPSELLLLLIYCVALECGYVTQAEWSQCSDRVPHLPPTSSFHSKNAARLSRLKPTYKIHDSERTHLSMQLRTILRTFATDDNETRLLSSLLTCLVSGDFLIVTLTPSSSSSSSSQVPAMPGRSVCLSIGRYVLSTAPPKGKPMFQRFRKLDELSALLRDGLFVPIRNRQLDALGVGVYPSLLGLPAELYENVFRYLSRNQLKILANVCRHLHYFSTHSRHYAQ